MNSLFLFNNTEYSLNMKENHYSIKDLENLTHIKAHTIRIWEQRYKILTPQRTSTNIRYYTDNDLRKILNVNTLYTNGLKISKIAALSESDILKKVEELIDNNKMLPDVIQELIHQTTQLNETGIYNLLEDHYSNSGLKSLYENVLIPTFIRIGELWQLNSLSIGHEHLFTHIARNFIIEKTRLLPETKKSRGSVLLFLHAGEEHEISLLIYNYLLREAGYKCYYLGQNMPLGDFEMIYKQISPDYVFTNFVKFITEEQFDDILKELYRIVPIEKVAIGGSQALSYKHIISGKSKLIASGKDLDVFIV